MPRAAKLNEFMFFSSVRVRSSSEPAGRTDTLTSKRSEPFSISASEMPSSTTVCRSSCRNRRASSGERRSGAVTISTSGVPPRLKSTSVAPGAVDPAAGAADVHVLRRVLLEVRAHDPDLRLPLGPRHEHRPSTHSGSSYWEIWYPFGRSG